MRCLLNKVDNAAGRKAYEIMPTQEEIDGQKQLIAYYRRTLAVYLQQQAQIGGAYIPPSVINGIHEARENIYRIKNTLKEWGVFIEDHLDDEQTQLHPENKHDQGNIGFIDIPIVIVTMTYEEAIELTKEIIFSNAKMPIASDDIEKLRSFKDLLLKHNIVDFSSYYKEIREMWNPFFQSKAIYEIVFEIFDVVNHRRELLDLSAIRPRFLSKAFFSEDQSTYIQSWHYLRQSGGILIVDAVSLLHPRIRYNVLRSGISSVDHLAMIVLSPIDPILIEANRLIEEEVRLQLESAFMRFDEELDVMCEFGVRDIRTLQRRLFAILPETSTIVQSQKANPVKRMLVRSKIGNPIGMEHIIFGYGDNK